MIQQPGTNGQYVSFAECGVDTARGIDAQTTEWLAPFEQSQASRFGSILRRRSWVAGRIAAKRILLQHRLVDGGRPEEIAIVSHDAGGRGIAPRVQLGGRQLRINLSISHSDRGVLVGVSHADTQRIGVDLVPQIALGSGFRRLWFTDEERAFLGRMSRGGRFASAVIWAAKEAVYKTLDDGHSFAPRQIEILPTPDGPLTCRVRGEDLHATCQIHHWSIDGHVACLAVRQITAGDQTQ